MQIGHGLTSWTWLHTFLSPLFSDWSRMPKGETISRLLPDFLIDARPDPATIIRATPISNTLCDLFQCDLREATLPAIAIGHIPGL